MNRLVPVLFILLFSFSLQAQILYVKADASGANNGTSWADAYTDLQNAITTANYGTQIWVAIGTYEPGANRDAYFELKNGVEIYGGFLGTETEFEERDFIHNESILSGDIGIVDDSLDNSYTIVYSLGTDENTILEGFTIQGGNANYTGGDVLDTDPRKSGGGMYLSGEQTDLRCQIKHCHFKNNHSDARGGGLFVWAGATSGSTRPNIFANEFTQNTAGTLGGGFYWIGGTYLQDELIPADSLIFNNNSANVGGGIHMTSRVNSALTKVRNCSFTENVSNNYGGGLYFREDSFENIGVEFEGCNFIHNTSILPGAGIFYESFYEFKNVTVRDCFLDHNDAGTEENPTNGGGIFVEGYVDTNPNAKILVDNTTMYWNTGHYGGAISPNVAGAVTIEVKNSIFKYNTAALAGGAIHSIELEHKLRVYNTYFEGNAANDSTGGGIHVQSSDVEVTNCVFNDNTGKTGAGIRMINGSIHNCIFYKNKALQQGAGVRCNQAIIANCIFWKNTNFGIGPDIYNNSFPITVESCLFSAEDCEEINYDNSNINCNNTIFDTDPLFTDPEEGDFSVSANSIVRDAGDNSTYPVEITEDYFGYERFEGGSIDIGVYELPPVNISSVIVSADDCHGDSINNGAIDYEILYGATPLSLTIGDIEEVTDDATGTISGLAGGTYDFIVTDAVGNSSTQSIIIPNLALPTIETVVFSPTCNSYTNGSLVIHPTGETSPFTILWDIEDEDEDDLDNFGLYGISAGTYCYTLTDAFDCEITNCEIIIEPEDIVITGTTQSASCEGSLTGQINITPTGGTGILSTEWSPNPNDETGYQLTNLPAGFYNVTVTDESNCGSAEQYYVSSDTNTEISGQVTDVSCNGSILGAITVTPLADSGTFSYIWSNEMTGATISGLTAGNYIVTMTDENSCEVVETYTVFADELITFSPTFTPILCVGGTNGGIDLNIEDTNGLNFTWSPNVNGQTGTVLTELTADTYVVTMTDATGCQVSDELVLSEPVEISLITDTENISCEGGNDGLINVNASGGTPLADCGYTYTISPALDSVDCGVFTGATANNVYILTAMDANGCQESTSVELIENEAITAVINITNVSCFGEADGSVDLEISGGEEPYTIEGETENLGVGEYSVEITDVNSCQFTSTFTISENAELTLNFETTDVSCPGLSDGSVDVIITGGMPPYTIEGMTEDLSAGDYTVNIMDVNNCQLTGTFTITEDAGLTLNFETTDVSCPGFSDGSVEVIITGGIAPYTIEGMTEDLSAGEYTVMVSDVNSCGATETFTISQPNPLNFDFDIVNAETSNSSDGNVFIENITGGTAPYEYEWSNEQTTEDLTNVSSGIYNLLITDANDCIYSFGFEVDYISAINDLSTLGWKIELLPNILVQEKNAKLLLETDRNAKGQLQIYNSVGQVSMSITMNILLGKQQFDLNTENLSPGIYFVKLEIDGFGVEVLRLVVVK